MMMKEWWPSMTWFAAFAMAVFLDGMTTPEFALTRGLRARPNAIGWASGSKAGSSRKPAQTAAYWR
jgi:hypothetical protein